jgi:hypothetical protein
MEVPIVTSIINDMLTATFVQAYWFLRASTALRKEHLRVPWLKLGFMIC